jgi:hypothetical protein
MKYREALIAWTPASWPEESGRGGSTRGHVKVDRVGGQWHRPYAFTGGAEYSYVEEARGMEALASLFIEFHDMVVRDGINPQVAHEAFLAIDEYRESIAPSIPGANR